jgi:DNA-binding NarL/FixJ family response regulator
VAPAEQPAKSGWPTGASSKKPLRILLVDDHELIRAGVRAILELMPEIRVVGEAIDGASALRLVGTLRPNIVVLDLSLPDIDGFDVLRELNAAHPSVRTIVLSMHSDERSVRRVLALGASAYIVKDSVGDELRLAVQTTIRGGLYLSGIVSPYVVGPPVVAPRREAAPDRSAQLTDRQREIVTLIASGLTTAAIAHQLGISVKTVETHRAQLMDRLGIHDVAGLVRFALREGLIPSD